MIEAARARAEREAARVAFIVADAQTHNFEPARFDASSIRDMRVEALRTVATPSSEWIRGNTVRARYTSGKIGSRKVPSYVDEPGVDPKRNTETYASVTLEVESDRWEGVPFTLRSGKAMAEDPEVARCAVNRVWNYAMSRGDIVNDLSTVPNTVTDPYFTAFSSGGMKIKETIRAIFKSEDFTKF